MHTTVGGPSNVRSHYLRWQIFFCAFRRIHEGLEESRHRRPVGLGRSVGEAGLGGVGRWKNGAGGWSGPAGPVSRGVRCRAAVRHARAPAKGPAVSPRHPVLPDDHHRPGQRNDVLQGRDVGNP